MCASARLGSWPTLACITLLILAWIFWWPLGLAILALCLWSGTMGCCGIGLGHWAGRMEPVRQSLDGWRNARPSGNRAFDEYRAEALRRLEEEQREFQEFLSRLRMAKDRTEFEQFMGERGARPGSSQSQTQV